MIYTVTFNPSLAYNKVSNKVLAEGGYIGGHPIRNSYYLEEKELTFRLF